MTQRCSFAAGLLAMGILTGCDAEAPPKDLRTVEQPVLARDWQIISNTYTYESAALTVYQDVWLDAYFQGTNGHLMFTGWFWSDPYQQWITPLDLGMPMTGDPTVFSCCGDWQHIFYTAGNGHLMHAWWYSSGWGGPEDLGGSLWSSPSAVSWAPGDDQYEDVFYMGSGYALKHRWASYSSGQWSGEESFGGYMTSAPAATYWPAWGNPYELVFYRNASGGIDLFAYNGSWPPVGPSTWQPNAAVKSGTHPTATTVGNDVYVYWRRPDNALAHAVYPTGSLSIEPGGLTSSPAATSWDDGRIDVLARRTGDNRLQQRVYAESMDVPLIPQEQDMWCWAASEQMIIRYNWGWSPTQCDFANDIYLRTDCCPNNPSCNLSGGPNYLLYNFHWAEAVPHMTVPQVQNEVMSQRPWYHTYCYPPPIDMCHVVVGVGGIHFDGVYHVAINDPWPPGVGAEYVEWWPAYDGETGEQIPDNDVYEIY
jgi:hypothetical protein